MPDNELSILGQPVRALVGGRMMTVILTDYDSSSSSYNGVAITVGKSLDVATNPGNVNGIEFRPVRGLREYPYTERPSYAFQFVYPGDDESVLLSIGQTNADNATQDPRDTDGDGQVSKAERKAYNKNIENQ